MFFITSRSIDAYDMVVLKRSRLLVGCRAVEQCRVGESQRISILFSSKCNDMPISQDQAIGGCWDLLRIPS